MMDRNNPSMEAGYPNKKEEKEISKTTLRTIYFQSISSKNLESEMEAGLRVKDVCFMRAMFGLKGIDSKSSGQLMPLGGILKESSDGIRTRGWITDSARSAASRTHTAPMSNYTPIARRGITQKIEGTAEGKKKTVLFLSARISPYDTPESLHSEDSIERFHMLSLGQLQEAFQSGKVRSMGADRLIMDSLLPQEVIARDRPHSPIIPTRKGKKDEDDVVRLQSRYIEQFKLNESQKKRDVLTMMVRFGDIVSIEEREVLLQRISDSQVTYEEMQDIWVEFFDRFFSNQESLARETVAKSLKCANFLEELLYIKENLPKGKQFSENTESMLRLFLVVPGPHKISPIYKQLLEECILSKEEENGTMKSFFYGEELIQENQKLEVLKEGAQNVLESVYGIPSANYYQLSVEYGQFLRTLVEDVFDDLIKDRQVNHRSVDQFEGIGGCDAQTLLSIISGRGKVVNKFESFADGGRAAQRLLFEARRKLYSMETISKSIPIYENLIRKGNAPFAIMWDDMTSPPDIDGWRTIDFEGNKVNIAIDTRVKKRESYIRKVLLRGEASLGDVFASSVILETVDRGLIERTKQSVIIKGELKEVEDSMLVFNFWEKIQKTFSQMENRESWECSLDRFEPTPKGGAGYRGKSPGSSSGVRFGKIFVRVEDKAKGVSYIQEIQIFTPEIQGRVIVSANEFAQKKHEDDERYKKHRLILGKLRSFAEAFFPHALYPATPKAHKRD